MRLRSVVIFGVGYLAGTRAGRDRYEQIAGSMRELADSGLVRGYVDRASELARRPLAASGGELDEAEDVEGVEHDGDEGGR